jgi:hypothetical protein
MPDIDLVVLTASIPTSVGGGVGTASLVEAHKRIVERLPRGWQLFAHRSSHRMTISEGLELIVGAIRSILERRRVQVLRALTVGEQVSASRSSTPPFGGGKWFHQLTFAAYRDNG